VLRTRLYPIEFLPRLAEIKLRGPIIITDIN
jgi:hypothetical protein